jgi:hypothetical protein
MTVEEARSALRAAPRDHQLSAIEPNVTRNVLFTLTCQALEKLSATAIYVSPVFARHIACVAQDTLNPVPMRFIYGSDGVLVAGWNREQQQGTVINGSYPHLVLSPYQTLRAYKSDMESLKDWEDRQQEEHLRLQTQRMAEDLASMAARAKAACALAKAVKMERDLQDAKNKPKTNATAKPPPDPTSPKFVLKRPKI